MHRAWIHAYLIKLRAPSLITTVSIAPVCLPVVFHYLRISRTLIIVTSRRFYLLLYLQVPILQRTRASQEVIPPLSVLYPLLRVHSNELAMYLPGHKNLSFRAGKHQMSGHLIQHVRGACGQEGQS